MRERRVHDLDVVDRKESVGGQAGRGSCCAGAIAERPVVQGFDLAQRSLSQPIFFFCRRLEIQQSAIVVLDMQRLLPSLEGVGQTHEIGGRNSHCPSFVVPEGEEGSGKRAAEQKLG